MLSCCMDGGKKHISELKEKIDSLQKANTDQKADISNLTDFITIISDGLDSIALQEDMLLSNKGREGIGIDKEQLRKNLEAFESMLTEQKRRITNLADSLKARGLKIEKLNNLVAHLNQQLDEKNQMIQLLKDDIDRKNVSISRLNARVSTLSESNDKLSETVERQVQALKTQDNIINEGYVKMGTKRNLKAEGFLSGGFLRKTKVNYQSLTKEKFMKVDIRVFREITINSDKPKILTQMPTSSYEIVKKEKGVSILRIIDANAFWSISNFLVIQTD